MTLALAILEFCLILLIIGGAFYVLVWVLGLLGIAIPPRVLQFIAAIVFILILIWVIQAVMGGGGLPRLGILR